MGFSLFSNGDKINYGIKNYVADTENDLDYIPHSAPSSMVFVIENSTYYILNNKNEWIIKENIGNSNGGIQPSGKITLTENAIDVPISQYALADVVVPVPVMPDEYCISGSLYNKDLVKYHFPETVSIINGLKESYFSGCTDLEELQNFPVDITIIPYGFAYNCKKLNIPSLPNGITIINQNAFYNCSKLTLSTLPSQLTTIGNAAFAYCPLLSLTTLPTALTSINASAFQGCSNIKITQIPSGVTKILPFSFSGCSSIERLAFAGDVTEIGQGAFQNCSACMVYDFRNNTDVPTLNNRNTFTGINNNAKIVAPDILVTSWKAATNWVTYTNYIVGVSDYENS